MDCRHSSRTLGSAEKATWTAGEAMQAPGGSGRVNNYPGGRLSRNAKLDEIGASAVQFAVC